MLPLSVALLSAAALAYELLLMRLFSEVWWYAFAATVIGLALLGYAASGVLLILFQRSLLPRFSAAYQVGALAFAAAAPAVYLAAQGVSFNPLDLAWNPAQWARFAAVFLVLSVPFLFAGGCVGLALRRFGDEIPGLYAADLTGAGAGAAGAVALLHWLPAERCVVVVALIACAASLCVGGSGHREPGPTKARWIVPGLALALVLMVIPSHWLTPRPSQYKGLSRRLLVPGARILEERSGPGSRIQVVHPGTVPFRRAPGLSLGCAEDVPPQLGLFVDGEMAGALVTKSLPLPGYLDCLPLAAPFAFLSGPRVAVLGTGGGTPVLAALRGGASTVVVVEGDRQVARWLAERLGGLPGARVTVRHDEPRSFLSRKPRQFDMIQLDRTGGGGGPQGVRSTAADFLATAEGMGEMLSGLAPGGLVAVTSALDVPPKVAVKWFATAVTVLEGRGVREPGLHLAWFRDWSTATLLVGRDPLGPARVDALREFCAGHSYDLVHAPGVEMASPAQQHHRMGEPWLANAAVALLGTAREAFLDAYPYFVEPATDNKPFFYRFFRWNSLPEFWSARGRGGEGLVGWGYLLTPLSLALAAVGGGMVTILPMIFLFRGRIETSLVVPVRSVGVYFGCLGVAFLLVEVVALKRAVLLLGHPVAAAATVLAGFLVFAGAGSRLSPRLWGGRREPASMSCWAAAVSVVVLQGAGLPGWSWAQPLSLSARVAVVFASTAPAAFLMGTPFPLGLGRVASVAPKWVPWAWAVNGFGSVISASLGALVAVHLGFAAVLWIAVTLYGVAAWSARGWGRNQ